jgi:hypothetical protein
MTSVEKSGPLTPMVAHATIIATSDRPITSNAHAAPNMCGEYLDLFPFSSLPLLLLLEGNFLQTLIHHS